MWPGPYGQGGGSRKYVLVLARPVAEPAGPGLRRHLLQPPVRPGHARSRRRSARSTTRCGVGKALYAGISSYSAEKTREAATIARELGTPLLIHQPSYSMLNRWIEEYLLDELDAQGMGCIVFGALAQGLLTDRYLDGIPADSRAAREGSSVPGESFDEKTLTHVRALNEIAAGARPEARPARAAVGGPRPAGHLGGDRCVVGRAARHQPRRARRPGADRRRAGRDRPARGRRRDQPVGGVELGAH